MIKANTIILKFCNEVVKRETFTQKDAYKLSELINTEIDGSKDKTNDWPINILLKPLKNIWSDGKVDTEELRALIEIIFTVVFTSEVEISKKTDSNLETKKCPQCDKVLMSIKVPRCSWCGKELKEYERYIASENWAHSERYKRVWNETLDKRKECYENWFKKFGSHSNNWLVAFLKQVPIREGSYDCDN